MKSQRRWGETSRHVWVSRIWSSRSACLHLALVFGTYFTILKFHKLTNFFESTSTHRPSRKTIADFKTTQRLYTDLYTKQRVPWMANCWYLTCYSSWTCRTRNVHWNIEILILGTFWIEEKQSAAKCTLIVQEEHDERGKVIARQSIWFTCKRHKLYDPFSSITSCAPAAHISRVLQLIIQLIC